MEQPTVERFTATISTAEYISRFRDVEKFLALCRQCPNYGNSWACPPFDFDTEALLRSHPYMLLIASKITLDRPDLPLDMAQKLIAPERIRIDRVLLNMEHRHGGRSFSYVGKCLYCDSCTRRVGRRCLHPDKVRPSLESFGFDIAKTLGELFGIELLWGTDGHLPPYLTLVSGFIHSSPNPLPLLIDHNTPVNSTTSLNHYITSNINS